MTREAILAEIRALQRQKEINPEQTHVIDAQLTELCDRLKSIRAFVPRKGIV